MGIHAIRQRAVFLDRDGVLNHAPVLNGKPHSPSSIAELKILEGVADACTRLHEARFLLIVLTNQPDVERGYQQREVVEAINGTLAAHLPIDEFRVCYHDDSTGCKCRKPEPGMIFDAAQDWNIDLSNSFMVGDRWVDIDAGRRAGCRTVLVRSDYRERKAEK